MKTMRLVIAGTPGCGKSTFVRTISDVEVVDTERNATDSTAQIKRKTTVAFDYGRFGIGSTFEVQVYGTPGQSRFNFMWDFLIKNAHTYTLLVAAHRPSDFHYARQIISFMNQRVQIPMLIGLTHTDCSGACAADEIMIKLGYMNERTRPVVININPNERHSVVESIMHSMALLLAAQAVSDKPVKVGDSTPPPQSNSRSSFHFPTPQYSRGN
jgi:uncharacterized protein